LLRGRWDPAGVAGGGGVDAVDPVGGGAAALPQTSVAAGRDFAVGPFGKGWSAVVAGAGVTPGADPPRADHVVVDDLAEVGVDERADLLRHSVAERKLELGRLGPGIQLVGLAKLEDVDVAHRTVEHVHLDVPEVLRQLLGFGFAPASGDHLFADSG